MSLQITGFIFTIILLNIIISLFNKNFKQKYLYCGLIGYSGVSDYNVDKLKFIMLLNSIDRGGDATGFYNTKQQVIKAAENAKVFIPKTHITKNDNFIGHVRAKTVGVNTDNNAHPFKYDTVVLAHNGTLQNHYNLLNKYQLEIKDFNVDSQCLAGMLDVSMSNNPYDNYDPLEYFKPITEIIGAAALLFKDRRDENLGRTSRLFAYRNSERPLCYGFDENNNMYISSIEGPLEALELNSITSFKENVVYEIENGEIISEQLLPRTEAETKEDSVSSEALFNKITKGMFNTDFFDLDSTWVMFDLTPEQCEKFKIPKLTKNKFYFVEKVDYESYTDVSIPTKIVVLDDSHKKVYVPIFSFNLLYTKFMYSKYGKVFNRITNGKGAALKEVANIGDIVEIAHEISVNHTTKIKQVSIKPKYCKDPAVNRHDTFIFDTNWLRPLTLEEVESFLASKKAEENKKKIVEKKPISRSKIPAIIDSLQESVSSDLISLGKEQLQLDPTLENLKITPYDYLDTIQNVKDNLDNLTLFLIKIAEKRKYALDNNLYCFNDLKPHLNTLYASLADCGDLEILRNNLIDIENE